MRLIALPIARLRSSTPISSKTSSSIPTSYAFTYFYAQPSPSSSKTSLTIGGKKSILTRATDWGGSQWAKLGKSEKDTWKWKTYHFGERLMDRIEFEEWALKSIDPAISPRPWNNRRKQHHHTKKGLEGKKIEKEDEDVPLIFPSVLLESEKLLQTLKTHLEHREPHHRKNFWIMLGISPLTWPFAIVPIIPNLPLFYVLWRAWSHWRAWQSSSYLRRLLQGNHVLPTPSSRLDEIYTLSDPSSNTPNLPPLTRDLEVGHKGDETEVEVEVGGGIKVNRKQEKIITPSLSSSTRSPTPNSSSLDPSPPNHPPDHLLLLTPFRISQIVKEFELPDTAEGELDRAREQVEGRIRDDYNGDRGDGNGKEKEKGTDEKKL